MKEIYRMHNDVSYDDYNDKTGITRIIDVCEKTGGDFIVRCYDREMNSDGDNNAMGITFSEIIKIMKEVGYECG